MAITPGSVSIADLRDQIRQRADMPTRGFVTDPELTGYMRASYHELYDLLVQKFGDDYFVSEYLFTTDGSTDKYTLPIDFYKLKGVDTSISPGTPNSYVRVKPFNAQERNQYNYPSMSAAWGNIVMKYRLWSQTLWIIPRATAGQHMRILYVPKPTYLSDDGTITLDSVIPGDVLTINGVTFTAVDIFMTAPNSFFVDTTDEATAVNLVTAIGIALPGVIATSIQNIVTLEQTDAMYVQVTNNSSTFVVPRAKWTSMIDGVSGWEEYILVDCVIKMKSKEESDVGVEMAEKQSLLARIEAASENRDASAAQHTSDVMSADYWSWS